MLIIPRRYNLAILLALATAVGSPLLAQDVGDSDIVIEKLEPIAGTEGSAGEAPSGRFKQAPFTTQAPPGPSVLIDSIETTPRSGARMRQLDKMTGLTRTFEIESDAEILVDRLKVRLSACRSPEGNARFGTIAFVQIWDTKLANQAPVFSGWMIADSPALSALDHPRYDVWVISCTTSPGDAPVASE